jgi:hypothetical protein
MDRSDVQTLVSTINEVMFSHTGEHLDDLQQSILEGVFDHQKYAEIAKKNHRSEKYIKDVAGQLWQTLSNALGEKVSKANIKSTLQRYHNYNFYNANVVNGVKIYKNNICLNQPELDLTQSKIYQQAKLETATELLKEGLSIEQIAKVLKLPIELIKEQSQ